MWGIKLNKHRRNKKVMICNENKLFDSNKELKNYGSSLSMILKKFLKFGKLSLDDSYKKNSYK